MADDFASSTRAAADGMMEMARAVVVATTIRTAARMIDRSPVDTGNFKGSWHISVDQRDNRKMERLDPGGAAVTQAMQADVQAAGVGRVVYFQNDEDYAQELEDGHSKQAPPGTIWRAPSQAAPYIAQEEARRLGGDAK